MLAPLKIWKWLKIAAEATTEDTAAAALGTDTPVVTATTKATTEATAAAETTEAAAAVMADPAADMATRDTVVVVINTKKAWQTSCKRSMLILKHRKQKNKTRKIVRSNWFGILIKCSFGFNKTISTLGI
jgi:hypothetical protein